MVPSTMDAPTQRPQLQQYDMHNQQYNYGLPPRNSLGRKRIRRNLNSKTRGGNKVPNRPEWDDSFARKVDSKIPQYHAINDNFAQGYMGQLKKHGNYRRYINEIARGTASVQKQRLRSVMNMRERQGNYRTRRNIVVGGVQGMSQQLSLIHI